MKNILVPTDFSDNANRALQYAVLLAQNTGAEITLLNVYDVVLPADGTPLAPYAHESLTEENKIKLAACAKQFIPQNIKYHVEDVLGDSVNRIAMLAEEKKMDLVVMGIRGSNRLSQIIIGSTTTAVIRNIKVPVFVIPENAEFALPAKILFAYDGKEIPAKATMRPLKNIAEIYKSKILVLNVINDLELEPVDKRYIARETFHALGNINYAVHFEENGDVLQGISNFITKHDIDAVAMIYHSHRFFNRIFSESHAQKMAFYTKKPLLILPEIEA